MTTGLRIRSVLVVPLLVTPTKCSLISRCRSEGSPVPRLNSIVDCLVGLAGPHAVMVAARKPCFNGTSNEVAETTQLVIHEVYSP